MCSIYYEGPGSCLAVREQLLTQQLLYCRERERRGEGTTMFSPGHKVGPPHPYLDMLQLTRSEQKYSFCWSQFYVKQDYFFNSFYSKIKYHSYIYYIYSEFNINVWVFFFVLEQADFFISDELHGVADVSD